MSQYPTPNQPYFPGINYNPSFFTSSSGVSLTYATNNFLQRTGTNPTSTATQTTFSGSINVSSISTATDSTIGGNLTINNTLKNTTNLSVESPLINLTGSVVCNNTGGNNFFNMNSPINQVFPTS